MLILKRNLQYFATGFTFITGSQFYQPISNLEETPRQIFEIIFVVYDLLLWIKSLFLLKCWDKKFIVTWESCQVLNWCNIDATIRIYVFTYKEKRYTGKRIFNTHLFNIPLNPRANKEMKNIKTIDGHLYMLKCRA